MRTTPWLCAALPPICTLALVLSTGDDPLRAQTASTQQALFVTALDRQGMPVEGLRPEALVVRENGVRREILSVLPADDPLDLTVIVDNSAAAREAIPFLRSALPPFFAALTPAHTVALVGIADRPTILVPRTTSTERLSERAAGLFATPQSGMTLLDAMAELSAGLRSRDANRVAIVAIVTDGTEFTNRYAKDVVASLVEVRAAVHLVTIGRFVSDTEHADQERGLFFAQAPRATGGGHLTLLSPHALGDQLQRIARELSSQYKVIYARPDSLIPPDAVEVTSPRDDLIVRATPERTRRGA